MIKKHVTLDFNCCSLLYHRIELYGSLWVSYLGDTFSKLIGAGSKGFIGTSFGAGTNNPNSEPTAICGTLDASSYKGALYFLILVRTIKTLKIFGIFIRETYKVTHHCPHVTLFFQPMHKYGSSNIRTQDRSLHPKYSFHLTNKHFLS